MLRQVLGRSIFVASLVVWGLLGSVAHAGTYTLYPDQAGFFAATGIGSPTQSFDGFADGTCLDSFHECPSPPGVSFTTSAANMEDDLYTEIHAAATEAAPTAPNDLEGGFIPGSLSVPQAIVIEFSPSVDAAGFHLVGLAPSAEGSSVEPVTIRVAFADESEATLTVGDRDGDAATAEYLGIVSTTRILRVTVTSGWISSGDARIGADLFGIDDLSFTSTLGDTLPPLCSRGDALEVPTYRINGIARDNRPFDSGIVAVSLLPGAANVVLVVDSAFPEIGGISEALFHVDQVDTAQDGQGVVLATDEAGRTCTLRADFTALAPGPLDNVVLCSGDGILFEVANESNPGGTSACSATLYTPAEPALPPGYEPSPDTDPFPCRVLTIESPISGSTRMVYKKDGVFDPRLRLLYSESLDGGASFPPFGDVTESVQEIAVVVPDPTRLVGTVTWTPVKITCAILGGVDCGALPDPDLDQDADGVPICSAGQPLDCSDQRAFVHPGAQELCNGIDDDCDGERDEGNPGGGGSCAVAGKLGACAVGVASCINGELVCTQTVFPAPEVCDGVDNDCNGEVDDGGNALLTTATTQFLAGPTVGDGDILTVVGCAPTSAAPLPGGSLPASLGIDALDVADDGSVTFSVRHAGGLRHAGGFLQVRPENLYSLDPTSGEVRTVLDWRSLGIDMPDLDALARLPGGFLAFSTSVLRGVRHAGGYTVLRPQNVYRFDPATRTIELLLDGVLLGLPDIDGVEVLSDGRIAFSTRSNAFVRGQTLEQQNAYTLERDGTLTLSLDGKRLGLRSLDDFAGEPSR